MKSKANLDWLVAPPSPRPSPPGGGESFAVSIEYLRLDWANTHPQNQQMGQGFSLSPGERARVRASVERLSFEINET